MAKGRITPIPEIHDPRLEEIEIYPIKDPYSFARVLFDKETNEYIYEVIEPQLTADEAMTLEILRTTLVKNLEYNFGEEVVDKDKEVYLRKAAERTISAFGLRLDDIVKERMMYFIFRDFVGYGVIDPLMKDEMIEDISCDGPGIPLFLYHKKYESVRSNIVFANDRELDGFVITMAQRSGKHISIADPILDATTPDGSRLQCTLSREVTTRGSSFTIRRFREKPLTMTDLLRYRTISSEMVAYMWLAVEHGESFIIAGGTASGKTATLNGLLLFVPPAKKLVTIEDTREINVPHENWIAGLTRAGFGQKEKDGSMLGEVTMYELLRAALRQRPEYMIVGEVRGLETYTMFQAMATGHTVYSTMHADSVKAMVYRLENPPIELPRILLSALNVVVIQSVVKIGKGSARRVRQIVEIVGIEPETNELITNTVYQWNSADDNFSFNGHSFMFERIMSFKNLSTVEMRDEFKRRVDVIEFMAKRGINDFREVANLVNAYYKDPQGVAARARKDLYG